MEDLCPVVPSERFIRWKGLEVQDAHDLAKESLAATLHGSNCNWLQITNGSLYKWLDASSGVSSK